MYERPDVPEVKVSAKMLLCGWHAQPFQASWPRCRRAFQRHGLGALLVQTDFAREWGGDPRKVRRLLAARPVCCRLPREVLLGVLLEVQRAGNGPWAEARCEACGRVGLGGPVFVTIYWGHRGCRRHYCLECVVRRKQPPAVCN